MSTDTPEGKVPQLPLRVVRIKRSSARFGIKLRELRKRAGVTLQELASASGLNIASLSLIENGKQRPPEMPYVVRIAKAVDLPNGTPEHEDFLRIAETERMRNKRAVHHRLKSAVPSTQSVPASPRNNMADTLRSLAKAIEDVGGRRIVRVVLQTDDGDRIRVRIPHQESQS